jgi:hypothetical protein
MFSNMTGNLSVPLGYTFSTTKYQLLNICEDVLFGVKWAVGGAAAFLTVTSIGFLVFARPLVKLE